MIGTSGTSDGDAVRVIPSVKSWPMPRARQGQAAERLNVKPRSVRTP
jgi:hypothetical protein